MIICSCYKTYLYFGKKKLIDFQKKNETRNLDIDKAYEKSYFIIDNLPVISLISCDNNVYVIESSLVIKK